MENKLNQFAVNAITRISNSAKFSGYLCSDSEGRKLFLTDSFIENQLGIGEATPTERFAIIGSPMLAKRLHNAVIKKLKGATIVCINLTDNSRNDFVLTESLNPNSNILEIIVNLPEVPSNSDVRYSKAFANEELLDPIYEEFIAPAQIKLADAYFTQAVSTSATNLISADEEKRAKMREYAASRRESRQSSPVITTSNDVKLLEVQIVNLNAEMEKATEANKPKIVEKLAKANEQLANLTK